MQKIQLNAEEIKSFLTHMVKNNRHLQDEGKIPVAINIEGNAGIGKTSTVLELAKELNMHVEKINLAQMEEVGDLIGFPFKEFQVSKESAEKWVPENMLPMYVKSGYKPSGKSRMSHAKPAWIEGKGENGFLILDDFSRANHMFMQAIMEICDRQEYISWKLPKGWTILLTSNPDNGEYNVTTLDLAQQTRFVSIEAKFDLDVWARWAEKAGIDTRCINFMLMHPEVITERYNARAFVTFFNSISSIPKFEEALDLIQMIGEGTIGPEASSLFTMFINNKLDKIIPPKDIMLNPNENYVVGALNSIVGEDDGFRADLSSIIATRVVNFCLVYAEKNSIQPDFITRLVKLTTDCKSFTDDLRYYMVKEILAGNKVKFSKLMMNPAVVQMSLK
jgi:DNA polymerase III delta prime subunit